MTTKKIVIIIASLVIGLALVVGLFVGGILLFVFHQVSNSAAAAKARDFLSSNERLKQDIGDVKGFGSVITGSINVQNDSGSATLNLKVIGTRKTVHASVELMYRNGKEWHVTDASYVNDAGQTVNLLNANQSQTTIATSVLYLLA